MQMFRDNCRQSVKAVVTPVGVIVRTLLSSPEGMRNRVSESFRKSFPIVSAALQADAYDEICSPCCVLFVASCEISCGRQQTEVLLQPRMGSYVTTHLIAG